MPEDELEGKLNSAEGQENDDLDIDSKVELSDSYPLIPAKDPQIAGLLRTTFHPEYETKTGKNKGKKQPLLEYEFQSMKQPERKSIFRSYAPKADDTKEKKQAAWDRVKKRFLNIYRAYTGQMPHEDLFKGAKGAKQGMEVIAKAMNTGNNGKPVFQTEDGQPIPVWLIPVYYGTSVELPLDKFIEKVRKDGEGKVRDSLIKVLPSHNIEMSNDEGKDNKKGGNDYSNGNFDSTDLPL